MTTEVRELKGMDRYLERMADCTGYPRNNGKVVQFGLALLQVGSYRVEQRHGVEDLCNGPLNELPGVIRIFNAYTRGESAQEDTLEALKEIEDRYKLIYDLHESTQ